MAMPRRTETVADTLAEAIASAGVRWAFGHPGGEVVVFIDALRRHGVRFLLTHHEAVAGFMALGHGELTGLPGVCVATLGPGATNLVSGAASGLLERAPMLALTGALATSAPAGTTHQALDLNALYRPITKFTQAVTAQNARSVIEQALCASRAPRRGSVHLSLPSDVAVAPTTGSHRASPPPRVMRPTRQAMESASRLLARASRPAVIVGLGALQANASTEVRALVHALGAPVATLPKAKGVFPEDDPLYVGALEMAGDDLVVEFLGRADVIVAIGVDPVEFGKPWRLGASVIHIDEVPNDERYYPAEIQLVGSIPETLRTLVEGAARLTWGDETPAQRRARIRTYIRGSGKGLHPRDVVDAVRAAMPTDTVATSDVGAHKMLVGQAWPSFAPRTFFMANGLSSMGFSVPVAAMAALLNPVRSVVAFVGDGGLSMYLGELETLVRARVSLLIVVFADRSLELIRRAQIRRHVPIDGVLFANPDFAALGRAFGIQSAEVGTRRALTDALSGLTTAPGVRLLAVAIDGDSYRF